MIIGNPNFHLPRDIAAKCGQFEQNTLKEADVTVTNFTEPFGITDDISRTSDKSYWIKSQKVGLAFKIDSNRNIVEYAKIH